MRRSTVKLGLDMTIVGVALVTLATFYHQQLASLLSLSPLFEAHLVSLALFWGGVCGCLGMLVTIAGMLRAAVGGERVALAPSLVILLATILLFFFLLYSSFSSPEPARLRPGESIAI
jgi:hypothetical protein